MENGSNIRTRPSSELPEPDGAEQSSAADRDQPSTNTDESDQPECPVCLQPCINAVKLPCAHVFCYLCVKGVIGHGRRACSLCRAEVPLSFLITPTLVDRQDVTSEVEAIEGRYWWYYEGRRGWWQYDTRAAAEIEEKYQAGAKKFEIMIAGFAYVIDLEGGFQYRRQYPTRRRQVKRDLVNIPDKRGVAGIVCRPPPRGATSDPPSSRSGGDGGEKEGENSTTGATRRGARDIVGPGERRGDLIPAGSSLVSPPLPLRTSSSLNSNTPRSTSATVPSIASPLVSTAVTTVTGVQGVTAQGVTTSDSLTERLACLSVDDRTEREDTNVGIDHQQSTRRNDVPGNSTVSSDSIGSDINRLENNSAL